MGDIHLNKPLYEATAKPSIKVENEEDYEEAPPKLPRVSSAARLAGIVLDVILLHFIALGFIRFVPQAVLSMGELAPWVGLGGGFLYFLIGAIAPTGGRTFGKLITRTRLLGLDGMQLSFGQALLRTVLLLWPLGLILVLRGFSEHADRVSTGIPTMPAFELLGPAIAAGWYIGNFIFLLCDPYHQTFYDRLCGSIEITNDAPVAAVGEYFAEIRQGGIRPSTRRSMSSLAMAMAFFLALAGATIYGYINNIKHLPADVLKQSLQQRAEFNMEGFGQPVPADMVGQDSSTTHSDTITPAAFQYRRRGFINVDELKKNPRVQNSVDRIGSVILTKEGLESMKAYLNSVNMDRLKRGEGSTSIPKEIIIEVSFAEKPDLLFAWKNLPVYSQGKTVPLPDDWLKEIDRETSVVEEKNSHYGKTSATQPSVPAPASPPTTATVTASSSTLSTSTTSLTSKTATGEKQSTTAWQ